jgi:hypothetical protein
LSFILTQFAIYKHSKRFKLAVNENYMNKRLTDEEVNKLLKAAAPRHAQMLKDGTFKSSTFESAQKKLEEIRENKKKGL